MKEYDAQDMRTRGDILRHMVFNLIMGHQALSSVKLIYTRHACHFQKKKNLGKVALRENLGAQAGFYFLPVPTIVGITQFSIMVLFAMENDMFDNGTGTQTSALVCL